MGGFTTVQAARKTYHCSGACGLPIKPGERYVRLAVPAWKDLDADADDEGRSVAVEKPRESRQWYVKRFHDGPACFPSY